MQAHVHEDTPATLSGRGPATLGRRLIGPAICVKTFTTIVAGSGAR